MPSGFVSRQPYRHLHKEFRSQRQEDIHPRTKLYAARLSVLLYPIAHLGVADNPTSNPARNLSPHHHCATLGAHSNRCVFVERGTLGVPRQQEVTLEVVLIDNLARYGVPIDVHIVEGHIDRELQASLTLHTFGSIDLLNNHNLTIGRREDHTLLLHQRAHGVAEEADDEDDAPKQKGVNECEHPPRPIIDQSRSSNYGNDDSKYEGINPNALSSFGVYSHKPKIII